MKVLDYILSKLKTQKVHMTLIDPEKQDPEEAGMIARMCWKAGTDAFMVGGSTGVSQSNLDATVRAIKAKTTLPVILFPAGAHTLSPYADAIYFMSVMNSRNARNIVGEQKKASLLVKKMGIEHISMGYVIVEPGMKVGEIGEADLIPRNRYAEAVQYALVAQYFGMDFFYLEAGSGAPMPVSEGMIRAVKREVEIPLVVGGGIRSQEAARRVALAGADIIVTGTIVEKSSGEDRLKSIVEGVKVLP